MNFPDAKIAVLNKGPFNGTFGYDGRKYHFPCVSTDPKHPNDGVTVVPYIIANFCLGVELKGSILVRDFSTAEDRDQSWAANRLSTMLPYGLKHARVGGGDADSLEEIKENKALFKAYEEWFRNGFDFALVETSTSMSGEEFAKLKGTRKQRAATV